MKQYQLTLEGITPLIMHADDYKFSDNLRVWRSEPANKKKSVSGDDRSPAWAWLGYLYHDGKHVGIPSDNFMTMLREAGQKTPTGKRNQSFKTQCSAYVTLDGEQLNLEVNGSPIEIKPIWDSLIENEEFHEHKEIVDQHGFELFIKRAKIGSAKHLRVRPMFRNWTATGSFTVIDESASGLNMKILDTIFSHAGATIGLCDWRPGGSTPGPYGIFSHKLTPVK